MPASLPASPLMSSASRDGDRYKGSARCKEVLLDVGQSMEIQLVRKKDSTETVMERKNSSRCVSERVREAARQRTRRSKSKALACTERLEMDRTVCNCVLFPFPPSARCPFCSHWRGAVQTTIQITIPAGANIRNRTHLFSSQHGVRNHTESSVGR